MSSAAVAGINPTRMVALLRDQPQSRAFLPRASSCGSNRPPVQIAREGHSNMGRTMAQWESGLGELSVRKEPNSLHS